MIMLSNRLIMVILLGTWCSMNAASPLKTDEYLLFVPAIAYEKAPNEIAVDVQVWIYEKERRPGMTTLLTKYLGIDKSAMTPEEKALLYARTQLFRVDSERNKQITIKLANGSIYKLAKTAKDGLSFNRIGIQPTQSTATSHPIEYEVYQSGTPTDANKGISYFAPAVGLSIISDIDDTIKDSNVLDRKQLFINTFTKEFRPINDMQSYYQYLATRQNKNVAFHYVSSSPIQLYPVLETFINEHHFPKGSFHLRKSTSWSSAIPSEGDSLAHKTASIEKLLKAYPQRKFMLIGDSGEDDPKIYAAMLQQHPMQIQCIAIRNVTDERSNNLHYQQLFNNIDQAKWRLFKHTDELKDWCIDAS